MIEDDRDHFKRPSDYERHTWSEYRELVLKELERLDSTIRDLNKKLDDTRSTDLSELKVKIAALEVRAGIWGAISGAVTGIALVLITKWHF